MSLMLCCAAEGKSCCHNQAGYMRPYCPADDLYCSIHGPLFNGLAKSKCLKEGDCGSLGRPCCVHRRALCFLCFSQLEEPCALELLDTQPV